MRKKDTFPEHSRKENEKENDEVQDHAQENRLPRQQEGEAIWRQTGSVPTSQKTNYNHMMTSAEGRNKLELKPAKEQQDSDEDTHIPDTLERQIEKLLAKAENEEDTHGKQN